MPGLTGPITNEGLRRLTEFIPNCTSLHLGETQLDADGLKHLNNLKMLTQISLSDPSMEDSWLDEIEKLQSIETVELTEHSVSEAAIRRFRENRPECRIEF